MATHTHAKKASLHTLGCRLNQSETALIAKILECDGYEITPFGSTADLAIINTCTVTQTADAKSRYAIRSFVRKNPTAYVAVIGCYSQMAPGDIARMQGVDLIIGNQDKLRVMDYVRLGKNPSPLIIRDHIPRDDFTIPAMGQSEQSTRANLKIQDGCDFMCSFCIIPFARGRARSRSFQNLIADANILAAQGVKELVLTGVNLGTYQSDTQTLCDVIQALDRISGIERIRISSIEPTTIPEDIFDWMNDPHHALVPYLHIPLQSGSNTILKSMQRRYRCEDYLDFIERAHTRVRGLCLGSDIMVGFPGETEADFGDSHRVLETSPLVYAHIFTYSERKGTKASHLDTHVKSQIKAARSATLRRLSENKRRQFYQHHHGQCLPVLFEKKKGTFWTGYTCNFIRVAVQSAENLENQIRYVKIDVPFGDMMAGHLHTYPSSEG